MSGLPGGVWVLAFTSLLNDTASEMIAPLMPLFVTQVLGGSAAVVGAVEGAADTTSAILKLLAGRWSDRIGRARPFVLGGYALSNVARPLIALATGPAGVLGARLLDRVGKGLRTSPRDALMGAMVGPEDRVRAYALHRAFDHAGSILGAGLAWWLLASHVDLRRTMLWSVVPGFMVVALVGFGLKERPLPPRAASPPLGRPSPEIRPLLLPFAVIAAGRVSDTVLLLRANEAQVGVAGVPLLWILLHIVKVTASLGSPHVAKRLGPLGTVAAGWMVYALVHIGFGQAENVSTISALFVVYGVYHGLTEGAERALISLAAPEDTRATAFGWYHLVTGLLALPAGLLIGGLWAKVGAGVAFGTSAALAVLALALLLRAARITRLR